MSQSQASHLVVAESRINILRAIAIAMLYGQHFYSYAVAKDVAVSPDYHHSVNVLVLMCMLVITATFLMVHQSKWPLWMTYATIIADGFLILGLITQVGGPGRIQAALLLPWIALSTIRLLRSAVWVTTGIAIFVYLASLTHYAYVRVGVETYYSEAGEGLRIARHDQLFFVCALMIAGFIADRTVQHVYRVVAAVRQDQSHASENKQNDGGSHV